jgi:hypothetical protein
MFQRKKTKQQTKKLERKVRQRTARSGWLGSSCPKPAANPAKFSAIEPILDVGHVDRVEYDSLGGILLGKEALWGR